MNRVEYLGNKSRYQSMLMDHKGAHGQVLNMENMWYCINDKLSVIIN